MTTTMIPETFAADVDFDVARCSRRRPGGPASIDTASTFAGRTLRQFVRTPQLLVVGALTSIMFLLIFRYVFGGAIGTGERRLRRLPHPRARRRRRVVQRHRRCGRRRRGRRQRPVRPPALAADPALGGAARPIAGRHGARRLGRCSSRSPSASLTGFRIHGSLAEAVAAVGLCLVYGFAFSWPFIYMGLTAGNAQAAQGMSFLAFPFVFVSSAYVPVESMPGWLQPIAEHQPITPMVGSVRALFLGDDAEAALGHSAGWFADPGAALVRGHRRRLPPAGHPPLRQSAS